MQGDFITVDEAYHWFDRTARFLRAVEQRDYAGTNLIGHPGVTTLWLGALGSLSYQGLAAAGWLTPGDPALYRFFLRLPVAITTALCVALAYPLLRRLFRWPVAWLACLFWSTDPFMVAHSKIVHVDALLASFMTLSLLAACLAFGIHHPETPDGHPPAKIMHSWPMVIVSAVAGGLAFLTKSPAVLLLPMLGLVGLWCKKQQVLRSGSLSSVLGALFLVLLLWISIAALVWLALWPAAWVDLPGAVNRVFIQVAYEGVSPHGWGNFFLGQPVLDPGPLFYPVAIALRIPPWTLLGVVLLIVPGMRHNHRLPEHTIVLLLLVFALLCIGGLSFLAKKFDRYALPIFPTLSILAAVGWNSLKGSTQHAAHSKRGFATYFTLPVFYGLLSAGLLANLLWYQPYHLAYYNPLLGGGTVASHLIPVGWGEGMEQAGRYIAAQTNGCDRPVASWFEPVLQPFACSPVVRLREVAKPGRVDYAVLYIDQIQRNNEPAVTAMLRKQSPVYTVHIHGIDYASIYQLPFPLKQTLLADFGSEIRLYNYEVSTSDIRPSGILTLTAQWQALASPSADYMLFVHVLDAQGKRVGQIDVPPGGPRAPTSAWHTGHYVTWFHPVPVLPDLSPGKYWLAVGLYTPQDFARLPVGLPAPPGAPEDGANVVFLPFTVER